MSPRLSTGNFGPSKKNSSSKVSKHDDKHRKVIAGHPVDLDRLITRVGCPLAVIGLLGIMVMPHELAFYGIIIDFFFVPMLAGIILIVVCIVLEARHTKYVPPKEED